MLRPTTAVKIYVAAPWVHRERAADVASTLQYAGFVIAYRWWEIDGGDLDNPADFEAHRQCAVNDLNAVSESDVVLVMQWEKSEGKAVETGAALTHGIPVIVYNETGKRGNIFHTLCVEVDSLTEAIRLINQWYPRHVPA